MRRLLVSLGAATAALAVAAPASAQYYPQPGYVPQGYAPQVHPAQGYAYGYNNWGHVRALKARVDRVQHNINRLDRRDAISERSADRLRYEARSVERRLHRASRFGLNPYEANEIEQRLFRLERRVRMALGRRWRGDWGMAGYTGYGQGEWNPYYSDRDRDGRVDQWEDDRGRDRDGRWERDRDDD